LQGITVRTSYEIEKGKLLCAASSSKELWIIDYVKQTEEKLRKTYGEVLAIQPFSQVNEGLNSLLLVRETEWICILNMNTNTYARVLRIPYYIRDALPTNNLIALLPHIPNVDEEFYNFAMVWGSKGNKVAKYSIDRRVIEYLGQLPQQPQQ
jgi:hypothetical protein